MPSVGEEYTCASCGGRFTTTTPDDEAAAEAKALFGEEIPEEAREIVCDPCYRRFLGWYATLTPEDHAAIRAGEQGGFQ